MQQFCENGKIIYATAKEANKNIKSLSQRPNRLHRHKYKVYKCSLGDHFHISTITKALHRVNKIDKYPFDYKSSGNIKTKNKKK